MSQGNDRAGAGVIKELTGQAVALFTFSAALIQFGLPQDIALLFFFASVGLSMVWRFIFNVVGLSATWGFVKRLLISVVAGVFSTFVGYYFNLY